MCKCLSIKIILLFFFSLPAWSQTEDHSWEAYVQASHANTNLLLDTSTSGLRLGAAWKPSSPFGLVADLGLHRGSQEGRRVNYTTMMAGLRISSSERGYASAFIQGLGGAYRTSGHSLSAEEMGWGYILSGGGGVDIRVINHIAVRVLQLDLTLPQGPAGSPVLVGTVSAGLVFRLGR